MRKTKEILVSLIVAGGILLAMPTLSHAALQANGDTPKPYEINRWIWEVRCMQTAGGTLGLTNTIDWDANGGKYLTSDNKNLDIHMQKNTEYGAMAILSASSYGNPEIIQNGGTTTGNETGIKINFNSEWVAAGQITNANNYASAVSRYKDNYNYYYAAKIGDAIAETGGWHGGGSEQWIDSYNGGNSTHDVGRANASSGLIRACTLSNKPGTIFAYYGKGSSRGSYPSWGEDLSYYTKAYPTRAVVVVGSGI